MSHSRAYFVAALCLLSLSAIPVFAQSDIRVTGVGGKIGLVDPELLGSAIGFGGVVDLGTVSPRVHLEGNLDFWSKSESFLGAKFSYRDIAVGGTARYVFGQPEARFKPFAGGGLGLHLLKATISEEAGGPADDENWYGYEDEYSSPYEDTDASISASTTKIGIDLLGGTRYEISPKTDFLGELRYRIVSEQSQLDFKAGVVFKLGE